jgi:hypothetical protein
MVKLSLASEYFKMSDDGLSSTEIDASFYPLMGNVKPLWTVVLLYHVTFK